MFRLVETEAFGLDTDYTFTTLTLQVYEIRDLVDRWYKTLTQQIDDVFQAYPGLIDVDQYIRPIVTKQVILSQTENQILIDQIRRVLAVYDIFKDDLIDQVFKDVTEINETWFLFIATQDDLYILLDQIDLPIRNQEKIRRFVSFLIDLKAVNANLYQLKAYQDRLIQEYQRIRKVFKALHIDLYPDPKTYETAAKAMDFTAWKEIQKNFSHLFRQFDSFRSLRNRIQERIKSLRSEEMLRIYQTQEDQYGKILRQITEP